MTLARKHFCLVVLMGLLVGHFGMAVHATTHAVGEASECELCLSYNDVSEALEALPERGAAPVEPAAAEAPDRIVCEKRDWAPFLQRDPPLSS